METGEIGRFADYFYKWFRTPRREYYDICETLAEASGVCMLCPKCEGHHIIVWRVGVPPEIRPNIGRWIMSGIDEHDITLHASVAVPELCGAHFFIRNGMVEMV